MEALKITAIMDGPVIAYNDGMHLDGPLSYGAFMSMDIADREALPPINGPWAQDFSLPLKRWTSPIALPSHVDDRLFCSPPKSSGRLKTGLVWGWHASAAHVKWTQHFKVNVTRPAPMKHMSRYSDAKKVQISSGKHKASFLPMPAKIAEKIIWFVFGDGDAVGDLLRHVQAIGKLSQKGYGRVRQWVVEPCADDYSIQRDGLLTRRMPLGWTCGEGFPALGSIRAPYHHVSRRMPCIEPDWNGMHHE